MADKGSNTWLWWSIGGIATLGLGLGIYYFIKGKREEEQAKSLESTPTPPPISTSSTTTQSTPAPTPTTQVDLPKSTPFTSIEQSNAFRAWVNAKYPVWAKEEELEMNLKTSSSMNNATIQLAWGKYGDAYYTENATNLNVFMQIASGAKAINGGVIWKSTDSVPRGEVIMYTDGKITANAVNAQGAQTKFVQGGWYKSGNTYNLMIAGLNQSVGLLGLRDAFWTILKKAGIFNDSTNSYSAFSGADGRNASVFGVNGGEGGIAQDLML